MGSVAELFDEVQFIYELVLAQLEIGSLGARFETLDGYRRFELGGFEAGAREQLFKRSAYLKSVDGEATDYSLIVSRNRTRARNQYLTHWIYPYKGKFHPQMVRALLNIIGVSPGDVVLDPFIGSGTTAVEAQLLGIDCIGIDANPLCVLQSRVKTESVDVIDQIVAASKSAVGGSQCFAFGRQPAASIDRRAVSDDERVWNFYQMARLLAISDRSRRRRGLEQSFERRVEQMIGSVYDFREVADRLGLRLGKVDIQLGDARSLPIGDNAIAGIITSPPYSIALDYVGNDTPSLQALGCDIEGLCDRLVGVRGRGRSRVVLYEQDLAQCYAEMCRVLRPGGIAAIVIGDAVVGGQPVRATDLTIDAFTKRGFEAVGAIDKTIFGLYNVMTRERILLFKKPSTSV